MVESVYAETELSHRAKRILDTIRTIFGHVRSPARPTVCEDSFVSTCSIDEIIQKLEEGYIVEETGRKACLPRLFRQQLVSRVKFGDWC